MTSTTSLGVNLGRRTLIAFAALLAFAAVPAPASAQRGFKQKDCLECHKKFAEKYDGAKVVHSAVKQRKCEDCHLRHGIVPALVLKKQGSALCLSCHDKKTMGLEKPVVHAAMVGKGCVSCHDAHGSNNAHMTKAAGAQACYPCHDKKPFDDAKVRQAFCYAVDKAKIIGLSTNNVMSPAYGILPPGMPGYNSSLQGLQFDAQKAKDLIAQSGIPADQMNLTFQSKTLLTVYLATVILIMVVVSLATPPPPAEIREFLAREVHGSHN